MSSDLHRSVPTRQHLDLGGGVEVTFLPDGFVQLRPGWFTDLAPGALPASHLDTDGCLVAGTGGLLVRTPTHTVMIDAGFGPLRDPGTPQAPIGRAEGGLLLGELHEMGLAPGDLDAVAITHLHTDHIGWALVQRGGEHVLDVPIVLSASEWSEPGDPAVTGFSASMAAVLETRLRLIGPGAEVVPGVTMVATPGHTAGHASYLVSGSDRRLLVIGDAMHSSLQVAHPDWRSWPDVDPAAAEVSRRRLLAELAAPDLIGFGMHFAGQVFGRVVGGQWRAVPEVSAVRPVTG